MSSKKGPTKENRPTEDGEGVPGYENKRSKEDDS